MTQAQANSVGSDEQTYHLTRRQALQGLATASVAAGAGVGVDSAITGAKAQSTLIPYDDTIDGIEDAAGSFVSWLTGGSEAKTPEEATKDAAKTDLKTDLYRSALTRKEANSSENLSNSDIANLSKDTAYEQGKIAAFTPLSNGETEQAVVDAGQQAVEEYFATVKKNILRQWNASLTELESYLTEIQNQGFPLADFFNLGSYSYDGGNLVSGWNFLKTTSRTVSIAGGDFTVKQLDIEIQAEGSYIGSVYDPGQVNNTRLGSDMFIEPIGPDGDKFKYLSQDKWHSLWTQINTIESEVKSGVSTWVSTVYGSLQAGEITLPEIASNLDLAQRALENEDIPRAKADLLALNLPVNLDREVTVTYTADGIEWEASGFFAPLGTSQTTWETGTTYDPATSGTPQAVIATDGNSAVGTWSQYNAPVDGGTVTFTAEPPEGVVYQIKTTAGEVATVEATAFSESSGNYTVDVSSQLDTPITEVAEVTVIPDTQNAYQVLLDQQFTITEIADQETGETFTSVTTDRPRTPQTDSNYTTAEEWKQLAKTRQQQYDELESLFEEVAASGGGGGGLFSGLPSLPGLGVIESAIVVILGIFGLSALSN